MQTIAKRGGIKLIFGRSDLKSFNTSISKEYLLTNGLGGYSSSTICGANIRKYHGLLIASLNPPVNRCLLLSKLNEKIKIDGEEYTLSTNHNKDNIEKGYLNEQSFKYDYFPNFNYEISGIFVRKKITMVYGENTVVINYKIRNNSSSFDFFIEPLVNNRDHHGTTKKGDFKCYQDLNKNGVILSFDINNVKLFLESDIGIYEKNEKWYEDMFYDNEWERGLDHIDSHFVPGNFKIHIEPYEIREFNIIASTSKKENLNGEDYFEAEKKRKDNLLKKLSYRDELSEALALSCDEFIVHRKSTGTKTVIAGYPWFTDWGRDTMISLSGLTLCTGRFEDAKEILLTFSKYIKNGLIPNMFPDDFNKPLYNTIDGTLWFFNAVYKYLEYTADYEFIRENIFHHLTSIIKCHIEGTDFGIKMDKDFLIKGGDSSTQLTWMDVKIDDFAVTPRQGKAVEINALWYNAVCIYTLLCKKYNMPYEKYHNLSQNIKESFNKKFWNEKNEYLYDYIDGNHYDESIRPNAVIAISLPYTMLPEEKCKKVINKALKTLYTDYGLKSLSKEEEKYEGIYIGDRIKRDMAYHQGTVWAFLMGAMITSINKWTGDKRLCREIIDIFKLHLKDGCINNISEIFDGDEPFTPRGCFAQAWSSAEILRAYLEDVL